MSKQIEFNFPKKKDLIRGPYAFARHARTVRDVLPQIPISNLRARQIFYSDQLDIFPTCRACFVAGWHLPTDRYFGALSVKDSVYVQTVLGGDHYYLEKGRLVYVDPVEPDLSDVEYYQYFSESRRDLFLDALKLEPV